MGGTLMGDEALGGHASGMLLGDCTMDVSGAPRTMGLSIPCITRLLTAHVRPGLNERFLAQ